MNALFQDPAAVLRFGREICNDLPQAERREWWLANGLGGYAAGTVAGTLTRRYHGLLFANIDPPVGRRLLLARADAVVAFEDREMPLHTNRWAGGAVEPKGYLFLESFALEHGHPIWRYRAGPMLIEHRVWMAHGANATFLSWRRIGGPKARLRVRMLATNRDHHGGGIAGEPQVDARSEDCLLVSFGGQTSLTLRAERGNIRPLSEWVRNFDLPVERERGLPDREDHLCVGEAEFDLSDGQEAVLVASAGELADQRDLPFRADIRRRDRDLMAAAQDAHPEYSGAPPWILQLVRAADSFVIRRLIGNRMGRSVIAGYPWFGDWGRDTMIALPGLTLATGRTAIAGEILRTFLAHVDRGMLPNYFPGSGATPEYNTVDATLWFIEAWRAYVAASNDWEALVQAWPVLQDIVRHHVEGTRYGIVRDPADGLLHAGEASVQLTWMDAKVGDWVVTPRIGKPVEVNALWYNALCAMADFALAMGENAEPYRALAEQARTGFARFVDGDGSGLQDVIDGPDGDDRSLRPNQILAVSLKHSPLDPDLQEAVLDVVRGSLLTSYGLRTLAPGHPAYRLRYEGGVTERDGSYHQGTVWPWLLGPYAIAEYRVTGDAALAQSRLEPIGDHLADAGLGTISEILDADPPHLPRGCPAQAWSVACILDAWLTLEKARLGAPRDGDST